MKDTHSNEIQDRARALQRLLTRQRLFVVDGSDRGVCSPLRGFPGLSPPGKAAASTVTSVNRYSTSALTHSTLEFCLGG